jgi:hypothetical protein
VHPQVYQPPPTVLVERPRICGYFRYGALVRNALFGWLPAHLRPQPTIRIAVVGRGTCMKPRMTPGGAADEKRTDVAAIWAWQGDGGCYANRG